jgi:hypothetical protein
VAAALCGDTTLEQLASISAVTVDVEHGVPMQPADKAADKAAELAHNVLLQLCTEPSHGLCPPSAVGRWAGADLDGGDGRGLRSFPLELNLSNSRTHS